MALVATVLCGCSGEDGTEQETDPEPAGPLRLVMDSEYVKVGEPLTFTVYKGDQDVTKYAEIRRKGDAIKYEPTFKADRVGRSYFYARYGGSNTPYMPVDFYVQFDEKGEFFKTALVLKFTATWCNACPKMTSYLEKIEKEQPGRLAVIGVHSSDTFAISEGEQLVKDFGIDAFPRAVFDYRTTASNNLTTLMEALGGTLAEERAVSGIALESSVEGKKAVVKAKVRIAQKGRFRICCAVVEDGIHFKGGTSDDGLGNYFRVLRGIVTQRMGEELGIREAGEEFDRGFTFSVPDDWNMEKCSVLVYVLRMQEDGYTPYVNNTATCALDGGSCAFAYEPAREPKTE